MVDAGGVVAPGAGVVVPGAGVVVPGPGVVAPGTGVVVPGTGVVGTTGGTTGTAVVTAVGVVEAGSLPSSVSFTNAKASIAPATRMIAPIATVGSCQFGV